MLILREEMRGEMRRLPSPNAEKEASRLPPISTADVCLYFKGEMVVRCDAYPRPMRKKKRADCRSFSRRCMLILREEMRGEMRRLFFRITECLVYVPYYIFRVFYSYTKSYKIRTYTAVNKLLVGKLTVS